MHSNTSRLLLFIAALHLCCIDAVSQTLKRKAWLGIITSEQDQQLRTDSIINGATMQAAGMRKGDLLVSINGNEFKKHASFFEFAGNIYANDELEIRYLREGKEVIKKVKAIPKAYIQPAWADVRYGELAAVGCVVRTIVYRPLKRGGTTPGIFFIPGYNCGSIESYPGNFNGNMIEAWVKKGYSVYTVEKSGLGDSYGCKACVEVDLQNDIDLFETAYKEFISMKEIDRNNVFIWGHSMGGIIAPLIAQNKPVKGIMVFGTVFRPWSEFLLEMHRVQKPLLETVDYAATEDFVRRIQKIYYEFFILKKTPAQLFENPDYRDIVASELEYKPGKQDMWGRHWRFWQQLDSINLAKAWQDLDCKVLVLHGASDFIQCSAAEPYLIHEAVNKVHPGNSTMLTIPGIDHLMMKSKDFPEAVKNMNEKAYLKGNFNPRLADETLRWMEAVRIP